MNKILDPESGLYLFLDSDWPMLSFPYHLTSEPLNAASSMPS